MKSIVKIDLCKSKVFAAARETSNPDIRKQVLQKLVEVSTEIFPDGDQPYPKGSYYKADGDSIYFVLEKPSVALRCAIEFMENWYHVMLSDFPECRAIIDRGLIKEVETPGKHELVSRAFENISIFEKDLADSGIYVTRPVTEDLDRTMVKFALFRKYDLEGEQLDVFVANYLDPRTIADSSLIHALFVANPQGREARDRVFELFLIEYALEKGRIIDFRDIASWCVSKGYSMPPRQHVGTIIRESSFFACQKENDVEIFHIPESQRALIERSKAEFDASRKCCISSVTGAIHSAVGSAKSTHGVEIGSLIENYLCAVFSEIRMMANYFRQNYAIFQESREKFAKFDYILKRALPNIGTQPFEEWTVGFLAGLREEARKNNPFIAAIFHNVLATYYLNRSTQVSAYQVSKLRTREIFVDTNVFYALNVSASSYHDIVSYMAEKLNEIGLSLKVFPFTLEEYEQSLESVERDCPGGEPSLRLIERNPWLLQEFNSNRAKYLGRISVCRMRHSVAGDVPIVEENYSELDDRLKRVGVQLERTFTTYSKEQVQELWTQFRNLMPSNYWGLSKYWDFIYKDALRPEDLKSHDVHCIQNLIEKTSNQSADELGLQTLFLTLDTRRLLRLRKIYQFILTPEQFLEFFLPYLFLADVPLTEAESFPNKLLAAGLSTLLVNRPPEAVDMLQHFLGDPSLLESQSEIISEQGRKMAAALNSDRLKEVVKLSEKLPEAERQKVAQEIARILEEERKADREAYYSHMNANDWKQRLAQKEQEIEKLKRTAKYWRSQARRQK